MSTMRVVLSGIILGQRCQNVLHFENPDNGMSHDAIVADMVAGWLPIVRNLQNNNWSWTDATVQRIDAPQDLMTTHPLSGQAGSLSGNPGPTCLSGLFSIRTFTAGRHGHGRFYLPGLHQDSISQSVLEAGAFAAYQTRANDLVARYGIDGTSPLILVVIPRNSPTDVHRCTSIIVRRQFGVQRRRNIGVGG